VLAGDEDRVCPVDRHEEITSRIKGARLKVLSSCGHISTLERPDGVSLALQELFEHPVSEQADNRARGLRLVEKQN